MSSIRSILEVLDYYAFADGCNDVTDKDNHKQRIDQALLEISQIIDGAKPKLMEDTSLIYKKWSVEMVLNEYQSNLKEALK